MPLDPSIRYLALGATDVRLVGKPYPLIYEACVNALREAGVPANARIAAVGDSLHHDVLGAARAGIDSIFVCSGVHAKQLGVPQAKSVPPEPARLAALLDEFSAETGGCSPTHAIAGFTF